MAGHSKWANIQHRKGRQDAARSKLFSKLSKEITVAAKMGDPDPERNPRLRLAVKEAKSQSVPKDVIERAISKSQAGDGDDYEEIRYEGYGPGGVAVIVEAMTDNRNRTASTVRSTFGKHGGNLGETGSVGFMFERKGQILYPASAGDEDTVMMAAIEAGAEDCDVDGMAFMPVAPWSYCCTCMSACICVKSLPAGTSVLPLCTASNTFSGFNFELAGNQQFSAATLFSQLQ